MYCSHRKHLGELEYRPCQHTPHHHKHILDSPAHYMGLSLFPLHHTVHRHIVLGCMFDPYSWYHLHMSQYMNQTKTSYSIYRQLKKKSIINLNTTSQTKRIQSIQRLLTLSIIIVISHLSIVIILPYIIESNILISTVY